MLHSKEKVYCLTIHFREIENVQSNCELCRGCRVQARSDLEESWSLSRAGGTIYNEIISSLRQVLTWQNKGVKYPRRVRSYSSGNVNEWRNRILWQPNSFQSKTQLCTEHRVKDNKKFTKTVSSM